MTLEEIFSPMFLLPRPELNVQVQLGPSAGGNVRKVAFGERDSRDLGAAFIRATLIMNQQDAAAIP
jgi:hypothetical protein